MLVTLLALCLPLLVLGQNLVQDPGFESCANGTWTVGGTSFDCGLTCSGIGPLGTPSFNAAPHTGSCSGYFGDYPSYQGGTAFIQQSVATVTGALYQFSFWMADVSGTDYGYNLDFGAYWDYGGANQQQLLYVQNFQQNYVLYSFIVTASSAATTLHFIGGDYDGTVNVDDVNLCTSTLQVTSGSLVNLSNFNCVTVINFTQSCTVSVVGSTTSSVYVYLNGFDGAFALSNGNIATEDLTISHAGTTTCNTGSFGGSFGGATLTVNSFTSYCSLNLTNGTLNSATTFNAQGPSDSITNFQVAATGAIQVGP